MQGIPEQRALYITAYWAAANSSVCVCVCARALTPSPTLLPTDPVPHGLLTLCPATSSGPQGPYRVSRRQ